MIISSGPIVIGQGCEFDYSGTQACKALREEGIRIVLLNSNPATIMTDPQMAERTYIEPITPEAIDKILALNPTGLYDTVFANNISMCGVIPTTAALFAANACGASRATLVKYTTSADATGDTSSVVGYAGIIVE